MATTNLRLPLFAVFALAMAGCAADTTGPADEFDLLGAASGLFDDERLGELSKALLEAQRLKPACKLAVGGFRYDGKSLASARATPSEGAYAYYAMDAAAPSASMRYGALIKACYADYDFSKPFQAPASSLAEGDKRIYDAVLLAADLLGEVYQFSNVQGGAGVYQVIPTEASTDEHPQLLFANDKTKEFLTVAF